MLEWTKRNIMKLRKLFMVECATRIRMVAVDNLSIGQKCLNGQNEIIYIWGSFSWIHRNCSIIKKNRHTDFVHVNHKHYGFCRQTRAIDWVLQRKKLYIFLYEEGILKELYRVLHSGFTWSVKDSYMLGSVKDSYMLGSLQNIANVVCRATSHIQK